MGKKVINQYLDGVAGKLSQADLLSLDDALELALDHHEWVVAPEAREILQQLATAAASLSPSSASSDSLVSRVTELLEDFRKMMKTGRPDLNIPVLEPAVINRMPVDIKLPPFE